MEKSNKLFLQSYFESSISVISVYFIKVRAAATHVVTMDNTEDLLNPGVSIRPLPVALPLAHPRASAYKDYEPDASKNRNKKMNIPVLDNCLISNESLQLSQR